MRGRLPILVLLTLSLATAGCFGGADDPPAGETTPTPTSPAPTEPTPTTTPEPTPTSPTPTSPAPTTPTPTEPTPPTPEREPVQVADEEYDFSEGDASGEAPETRTFEVAEGYGTLQVNVTFTPTDVGGNPVSLGAGAEIALLAPDGTEVGAWTEDATAEVEGGAGTWTLEFRKVGTVKGRIVVTAIP